MGEVELLIWNRPPLLHFSYGTPVSSSPNTCCKCCDVRTDYCYPTDVLQVLHYTYRLLLPLGHVASVAMYVQVTATPRPCCKCCKVRTGYCYPTAVLQCTYRLLLPHGRVASVALYVQVTATPRTCCKCCNVRTGYCHPTAVLQVLHYTYRLLLPHGHVASLNIIQLQFYITTRFGFICLIIDFCSYCLRI
jgi:hypothetical protein